MLELSSKYNLSSIYVDESKRYVLTDEDAVENTMENDNKDQGDKDLVQSLDAMMEITNDETNTIPKTTDEPSNPVSLETCDAVVKTPNETQSNEDQIKQETLEPESNLM